MRVDEIATIFFQSIANILFKYLCQYFLVHGAQKPWSVRILSRLTSGGRQMFWFYARSTIAMDDVYHILLLEYPVQISERRKKISLFSIFILTWLLESLVNVEYYEHDLGRNSVLI